MFSTMNTHSDVYGTIKIYNDDDEDGIFCMEFNINGCAMRVYLRGDELLYLRMQIEKIMNGVNGEMFGAGEQKLAK